MSLFIVLNILCSIAVSATEYIFEGVPNDVFHTVYNSQLLQADLDRLQAGDTYRIPPHTYYFTGGIFLQHTHNITIWVDGQLSFPSVLPSWNKDSQSQYLPCITIHNVSNVLISSHYRGMVDGDGASWWNFYPFRRPNLLNILRSSQVRIHHLVFLHSPSWSLFVNGSNDIDIHDVHILVKRTPLPYHTLLDTFAYNTHGIVLQGQRICVSNSTIWNEGFSIHISGDSSDIRLQYLNISGKGIVLSSKENKSIRRVHAKYIHFYKSLYGIIMHPHGKGYIEQVFFEHLIFEENRDWSIWIQSHFSCGQALLFCSLSPVYVFYDIVLRNVEFRNPKWNRGFILGDYLSSIFLHNMTDSYTQQTPIHELFPTLHLHTNNIIEVVLLSLFGIFVLLILLHYYSELILRYILLITTIVMVLFHYVIGPTSSFSYYEGVHA